MNWLDIVSMLWFLLPGFVATWVFAGLTAYPKLSEFERVVEALIFTAFAQTATFLVRALLIFIGHWWDLGDWSPDVGRVWSVLLALLIGLIFARLANHDSVHRWLRDRGFTSLTGYPSEWFGAFKDRIDSHFVVLHVSGERRVYGRVDEFPTDPKKGHFSLYEAEWVSSEGKRTALADVARILVPATEVQFVEFIEIEGATNGRHAQATTATATTTPSEAAGRRGAE